MSILEKKIRSNKETFDVREPEPGHMERFEAKLNSLAASGNNSPVILSWKRLYRIAAASVILMAVSAVILLMVPREQNGAMAAVLPENLQEVKQYYDFQTEEKLDKISECGIPDEQVSEIRNLAMEELSKLETQNEELIKEYNSNPGNKKVEQALIRNFKTKSDILDNIIERICKL
ncbi:MAG: hypothetical protein KKA81_07990 [Bacteroidetes bacterium]|nr:hypothetical protein [Bacteroidota bacterium]